VILPFKLARRHTSRQISKNWNKSSFPRTKTYQASYDVELAIANPHPRHWLRLANMTLITPEILK
jgi:hypothetical protein